MKLKIGSIILIITLILNMSGCVQNNNDLDESGKKNEETSTIKETTLRNEKKEDAETSKIMKYIKENAINGVNIYCDKIKLGDNISDVIEIYGEATDHSYVSEAKGIYYNYKEYNFTFGCNKGDEIFEIRSYSNELKKLSLNNIEDYFGTPDYENKTSQGETVIGYKVSDMYKLLFVFDSEYLDHYSVFYPEITANYMADDPGREW